MSRRMAYQLRGYMAQTATAAAPTPVKETGVNWITTIFMVIFHIGAIAALFMFSWKALFVGLVVYWIAGSLGIGMGYHRLLTHRGYKCSKWLGRALRVLAPPSL